MSIIRIWASEWAPTPEHAAALLEVAPRISLASQGIWADARGLSAAVVASRLLMRLSELGVGAHAYAGIAAVPVTAELAARSARAGQEKEDARVRVIERGCERAFSDPLPLELLEIDEKLVTLLQGVGIDTCGALAVLEQEAVEVRFGAQAVQVWRLARADDARRLFMPVGAGQPDASLDFIDYVVTDPERLIFTANALLGSVCDALAARGEHARRMTLTLSLGNRQTWQRMLKPARATASRTTWLRLIRAVFEKLSVPDAVAGVALEVDGTEAARAVQGDLFDTGFATAGAVEAALARIVEAEGDVIHRPVANRHPLMERRSVFRPDASLLPGSPATQSLDAATRQRTDAGPGSSHHVAHSYVRESNGPSDGLTLQMLPHPEKVMVETVRRRDHAVPIRYRDTRGWHQLITAAGPDRVSGGRWGDAFAREYFRAVTVAGQLVCLFHEAREDEWYLHGWWD
jgi:hypothetical protein